MVGSYFTFKSDSDLIYNPAIYLMHIYQMETKSVFWRDTDFVSMFIAALPTVAKIWG